MKPSSRTLCALPLAGALLLGAPQEATAAPTRTVGQRTATSTQLATLHPTLARGQRPEARYDADDNAAIDLFNGQLSFIVPIGQPYRIDSQLSLILSLSYSSQIWDFDIVEGASLGRPRMLSNAGLGFDLSLGRLLAPATAQNPTSNWMYVSSDGSQHLFYSSLHHDTPDSGDTGDLVQYTRDGSYLRLRLLSSGARRVEQGDGVVREFEAAAGAWRLVRVMSQAGNGWTVSYATDGSRETLTDTFGRVWTLRFVNLVDPSGVSWRLLDTVEAPAFGGQTALYDLSYGFSAVGRSCVDRRGGTELVPLLLSVTDPVGRAHGFEYTAASTDCHDNGRLRLMKLTSGGRYGFDYGAYTHPAADCQRSPPGHFVLGSGVVRKQKLQPDGTVAGTWTYTPQIEAATGGSCGFDARRTVVTTPLGDQHVYHFAVGTDAPSAGGPGLFALPIAPTRPDSSGQLHLSEEIYNCQPGATACVLMRSRWARWDQDQLCASTSGNCFDTNRRLGRTREVFEDDTPLDGVKRFRDQAFFDFDGLGHYRTRVQSSNFGNADQLITTRLTNAEAGSYPPGQIVEGGSGVYTVPDPRAPWFLEDYSFTSVRDELGNTIRTDACFAAEGWLLRSRRRADGSTLSANDVVLSWQWQVGEAVEEARRGGDLSALETVGELCRQELPTEGFFVARQYEHGALSRETVVDESGQPLALSNVDRTLDHSTGLTAVERSLNGLATTYLYDLAGRLTWEQPEEGAWTQWVYSPPTGTSVWNAGPRVTKTERPNGGGTPFATVISHFDVFNRSTGEWKSMPGGVLSGKRTQYNALDWKISESMPYAAGTGAQLSWTQYLNHDPLGRPGIIRPPEGATHDEVIERRGEREEVHTFQVGRYYNPVSGVCSESPATMTRTFDGMGRLASEVRSQGHPLPARTEHTELEYAPGGEIVFRLVEETVSGVSRGSRTVSTLDGRGFLLQLRSENLAGQVGSTTEYGEYDARGLAHTELQTSTFLPPLGLSVRKTYDPFGRLLVVSDGGSSGRIWKEFEYGTENLATREGLDRRQGQLVRAVRHNYFEGAHHTVTDELKYLGLAGRRPFKATTIATVSSPSQELRLDKRYTLGATYDAQGHVARLDYPVCATCAPGEPAAAGSVSSTYEQGWLVGLGGNRGAASEPWLGTVSWHVNGNPFRVTHANGVVEQYTQDSSGRPRPAEIAVTVSPSLSFNSGAIVYDGAGRECGRGDESSLRELVEPRPERPVNGLCAYAAAIDPFGQWSGEIREASCRSNTLSDYRLFDAMDRQVALLSRSALRQLTVNGVPYWQPDPTRFTRRFVLFGFSGEQLTEVEEHVTEGFRTRHDSVYALGRIVGRAFQTHVSGMVFRAHKHPLGVRNSRPDGLMWNSEL